MMNSVVVRLDSELYKIIQTERQVGEKTVSATIRRLLEMPPLQKREVGPLEVLKEFITGYISKEWIEHGDKPIGSTSPLLIKSNSGSILAVLYILKSGRGVKLVVPKAIAERANLSGWDSEISKGRFNRPSVVFRIRGFSRPKYEAMGKAILAIKTEYDHKEKI